jgi:hypothetical protein
MSAKIMGQVWELDLPANKQIVLLAMADHADHEGENVYPSLGLIAWKTGYSESQTRRIIKALVADGILKEEAAPDGKPKVYSVHLAAGKRKPDYKKTPVIAMTPLQNDTPSIQMTPQGLHPDDTPTPVIAMTPKPSVKPSSNHIDAVFEAIAKVWKTRAGSFVGQIRTMMLGTARKGEWADANFEPPAMPEEIIMFGRWWDTHHRDLTIPTKPEKIQRYFYEFRAKRERYQAAQIIPMPTEKAEPVPTDAKEYTAWLAEQMGKTS